MQNKNKIIGFGIVIALILLVVWFQIDKKQVEAPQDIPTTENQTSGESKTSAPQTGTKAPAQATKSSPAQKSATVVVTYTYDGFSPTIVVIKKGDTIKFINKSTTTRMWVASGPHPSHTAYPGFDQGTSVGYDGTYSFTFTQTGKFPFHNHVDSRRTGTIVVNYE